MKYYFISLNRNHTRIQATTNIYSKIYNIYINISHSDINTKPIKFYSYAILQILMELIN